MGATYTRQSSYTDGDVITAAHTNDEFNQLLAAFQASSGHTHDGTANEGGPITKLLGNTLTFGAGTADTDITVTFDGESNDGVLLWKEDEDYFEFSDDILIASTEKLQFRDTAIYINSSTDGQLDLVADTEIQIAATTIDMNGNADVSGTLTYGSLSDGTITITAFVDEDNMSSNSATLVPTQQSVKAYVDATVTAQDLDFQADSGGALNIDLDSETLTLTGGTGIDTSGSGNAVTFAIDSTVATLTGSQSLTNKTIDVDNNTVSNIEVDNLKSGVLDTDLSSVSSSDDTIASAKSIKAYVDAQVTASDLDFQGDSGGALSIDLDSETLDIAGGTGIDTAGSGNTLTVAIDSTVATLSGTQTLTNKTLTSPKINEDVALTSTATELNLLDGVSGLVQADFTKLAAVDATATELNIMDGNTSATSTTLADADRVVVNDAGTMKQVALTDFETYFESALDTLSNVTTIGTLNSGAISSGFGNIDVGSSNLTATGTISLGATSFNDNAITNVGDIALDSISADGTDINIAVSDNSGTALTIKQGSDAYLIVDTANSSESVSIGTGVSGTAITLGHSTSEVTVADNLTVTGDLTVSGTTTTVNSTTVNLNDHNIVLDSGNSTSAVINGAGITIEGGSGDDATFTYNTTGPQFELKLGSSFEDLQTAKLTASEIDLNGNLNTSGTSTLTGNVTLGGQLIMPDVTSAKILVADGTSFQEVAISGDVTIASNGAVTIANGAVENSMLADDAVGANQLASNAVVNASVASGAAIAFSKMADLTASRALVSDGSGDVSVSAVTSTEIGYLDGVTSAIQTQINAKATKGFATAMAIAL